MREWIYQYTEIFSCVMYFAPPILSAVLLYVLKRKLAWLSVPITVISDIIVWGGAVSSSHGRGIAAIFLTPQIAAVALVSLFIMRNEHKKRAPTEADAHKI